jgi:hypothetical protein
MAEKEIEILRKQIDKLSEKEFDLGIWKSTTVLVLDRIFGRDSEKISQIRSINYDYSSWTLRDTSGASSSDNVKKLGREILETIITELETFGLPSKKESSQVDLSAIQSSLEDALRISQYRELISIIKEIKDRPERKKVLSEKLQTYGDETVRDVLAGILSHPSFEGLQ